MHDYGLEHFDNNFRKDAACWSGTNISDCLTSIVGVDRGYTWWCNKRPNNPCVFNCPTQVRECARNDPKPQEQSWHAGVNTFARWPNDTFSTSAWDVDNGSGSHVVNYTIPNGWPTNLVTNYWPLYRKNAANADLYAGDFWFEGSKRVHYSELTMESGNFTIQGVPDGRANESMAYANTRINEKHYWSTFPTNETIVYNTSFKIWGTFTTFVTHLSNNEATFACHTSQNCDNVTSHSGGRFEADNIVQCPFQFRCFTPESASGRPGCHQKFPDDYADTNPVSRE